MRAVAQRPVAGLPAPAQRDDLAVDDDPLTALVAQLDGTANQQRPVAIHGETASAATAILAEERAAAEKLAGTFNHAADASLQAVGVEA